MISLRGHGPPYRTGGYEVIIPSLPFLTSVELHNRGKTLTERGVSGKLSPLKIRNLRKKGPKC